MGPSLKVALTASVLIVGTKALSAVDRPLHGPRKPSFINSAVEERGEALGGYF
jgi:hypothetical protein